MEYLHDTHQWAPLPSFYIGNRWSNKFSWWIYRTPRKASQEREYDEDCGFVFPVLGKSHRTELPDDVIRELSTDQKNCYLLTKSIESGMVSKELEKFKCGPLNHSRWLTAAEGLLLAFSHLRTCRPPPLRNDPLFFLLYMVRNVLNRTRVWIKKIFDFFFPRKLTLFSEKWH